MSLTHDELALGPDASSSGPDRCSGPVYTRVYLRGGRYAHLLEAAYFTDCGESVRLDSRGDWYGTGSQREYETAARMPLCPKCFAWRESGLDDPRLGTGHRAVMT